MDVCSPLTPHTASINLLVITLCCTAPCCNILYCNALYCTVKSCSAVQCSAVRCSAAQCSAVQYSALYCMVLYCPVLYRTVLHLNVHQCTIVCPQMFYLITPLHCYTGDNPPTSTAKSSIGWGPALPPIWHLPPYSLSGNIWALVARHCTLHCSLQCTKPCKLHSALYCARHRQCRLFKKQIPHTRDTESFNQCG